MSKNKDKKYGVISNLKFMIKEHNAYDKRFIPCDIASAPLAAITSVITAYLPKFVLDCLENDKAPGYMVAVIALLSVVIIVFGYAQFFLSQYYFRNFREMNNVWFYSRINNKLMNMEYMKYISGETRVKREKAWTALESWEDGICGYVTRAVEILSSLFGFTAFTAIIVQASWLFIPVLIVSYGLSMVGWLLLQKYKDKLKDERSAVKLKLGYVTYNSKDFTSAKDIRVYGMTDFLMRKINRHLADMTDINRRVNVGHISNTVLEDVLKFAIGIAAYIYLIKLKISSQMTIGDFSLYFGAITGFGMWLAKLVDGISTFIEADHKVNDFRNFLDIPEEPETEDPVPVPTGECEIELKDVSFAYEEQKTDTLNNVSLKIEKGEKIAIVGVNGAGKSTLVKLICGLLKPKSGEICVNGVNISDYGRKDYYSLLSTVFQEASILPSSIAKNIALCEEAEIDRDRLFECMRLAGILEKVNSLPQKENTLLVREVHEGGVALSGGETQRLLLARALYKDSPILILDEPTAALDPIAENDMYMKYGEFCAGKTAIYISHRLSSTRFCDRIYLLGDGRIIEEGTHEELLTLGGKYAEMFNTQSKYYKEEAIF